MTDKPDLGTKSEDIVAALTKLFVSASGVALPVPIIAPIAAEVIGSIIPGQRQERIVKFVRLLDERVRELGAQVEDLKDIIKSEEFVDLFEEATIQAARALSEDRREYLAGLLARSLTEEELNHERSKKLLYLLNELTDQEIIWLRYLNLSGEEQRQFYNEHEAVLESASASLGSSISEIDENALQENYKETLLLRGLLKRQGTSLLVPTWLGEMLIRYITDENPDES